MNTKVDETTLSEAPVPASEELIQEQAKEVSAGDETELGDKDLTIETIYDIPVKVTAVLGETMMPVSQLLKLGRGAVVELDRKVGEAMDIYVNGRLLARGEIVIVEGRVGVTMTEVLKPEKQG